MMERQRRNELGEVDSIPGVPGSQLKLEDNSVAPRRRTKTLPETTQLCWIQLSAEKNGECAASLLDLRHGIQIAV